MEPSAALSQRSSPPDGAPGHVAVPVRHDHTQAIPVPTGTDAGASAAAPVTADGPIALGTRFFCACSSAYPWQDFAYLSSRKTAVHARVFLSSLMYVSAVCVRTHLGHSLVPSSRANSSGFAEERRANNVRRHRQSDKGPLGEEQGDIQSGFYTKMGQECTDFCFRRFISICSFVSRPCSHPCAALCV